MVLGHNIAGRVEVRMQLEATARAAVGAGLMPTAVFGQEEEGPLTLMPPLSPLLIPRQDRPRGLQAAR